MLTTLDLFSGIGGFALGFGWAGITTTAFCELDPYARSVLAERFPGVPIHEDIRSLHVAPGQFDIISGGFPCQDISLAGLGAGLAGTQSGLWFEMLRVIGEARPRFVVIENVPALRSRGLEVVLGGLSALGYDAEWHCIPAAAAGADHLRDRVWVIAYPEGFGCGEGRSGRLADGLARVSHGPLRDRQERISAIEGRIGQPCLLGSPDGLPHRVDRVFALGNAVVPQIPALIGRALMASYTGTHSRPINDRH